MQRHPTVTCSLAILCLGGLSPAQAGTKAGANQEASLGKAGARPMPLHRPLFVFKPQDALRHLARGNRAMLAATQLGPDKNHQPNPLRRPAGAGRYVAAVIQSSGYQRSASEVFASRHRDLLVMASPGPAVRAAEVAAVEHAVREHRLSLLVILVHPKDMALQLPGKETTAGESTKAARALWSHVAAAHKLAAAARVGVAEAHGLLQAEIMWRISPYLRVQRQAHRFRIAVGILRPRTGAVHWVTKWQKVPPLVRGPVPGR